MPTWKYGARGDLSLDEKDDLVKQVELQLIGTPELKSIVTTSYATPGNNASPDSIGSISLEFVDWYQREPASIILDRIRERTKQIPGIEVSAEKEQGGPQSGADIQLQLTSNYSEALYLAADEISKKLLEREEIVTVNDDRSLDGIEWRIDINRAEASRYGVDVNSLGNVIKLVTTGITLSDFLPEGADDKIDIVLRYPVNQRSLDQLDQLQIPTNQGSIPASNFITRYAAPKQGVINRTDGKKAVQIDADVKDGLVVDEVIKAIKVELDNANIDKTVSYEFRGNTEEQQKSMVFLLKAFGVAFFIMAIILVTQFNNFFQCLLILSAVVFSTMGVFIGLHA
ncbi:efflux RND transporter permease subunit [Marinomonas sp. GJ51-6]|uniref:efflux RND transporter permease subunit n=1 Tax=Marinomonas sp. GJ51-6 TaxID=2992802 RepID=UPI0029344F04|nr:efflux RND transporter permease subunit [Marinomonas sp. GJ51-6]WOD09355.1 efflux RND transporter permease subunit [Marinomonas sp. GJ51-6]